MPRCGLRGIGLRPEFNGEVLLRRDGPVVEQRGRVTPLANGARGGRKKRDRATQEFDGLDLAERPDRGADPDDLRQSRTRLGKTRPNETDKLAGFEPGGPRSRGRREFG